MIEFNATFLVAMFSFVVFILIMNAIFYNPILGIIRKREDYISSNYEDSKRFEEDAKEYRDTHAAKMEQVQDKCRHEFKTSINSAQNIANDKIKAAKEKTKLVIQSKKDQLLNDEKQLQDQVNNTVVKELASTIASKLLGQDTIVENIEVKD